MADASVVYDEGERLKSAGKLAEAIEKYHSALEIDPTYALAHFALAVAYGRVGDHEAAIRHAQRACELEPNDPFSYTAMSVTYQRAFAGTQNRQFIQMAENAMARAHALEASR